MKRQRMVLLLVVLLSFWLVDCVRDGGDGDHDADVEEDGDVGLDGDVDGGDADFENPDDLSCLEMIPLRMWTTDPSAVALLYRIETCEGETVVLEPSASQSVSDLYMLRENGEELSSEAYPAVDRSQGQRVYVSLLLDYSSSTDSVKSELLEAARVFGEGLISSSPKVRVGIQIFDGREEIQQILLPTRSLSLLNGALTYLSSYDSTVDPDRDSGSTNLNGAFISGVSWLQSWQETIMSRNSNGVVTTGYLVTFTDGRDTSARVEQGAAQLAVSSGRESDSDAANVQTYAVALEGSDYNASARSSLQAIVGGSRYLYEGDLGTLRSEFEALSRRITQEAQSTHLLKYCSAARTGERVVELDVHPDVGTTRSRLQFTFVADGFSGGCREWIDTVCDGRDCGGFNCGAYEEDSERCEAGSGRCINNCLDQNYCSGERITNMLGYEQECSAEELGDVEQCGGQCIDIGSDPNNCGGCGTRCDTSAGQWCEGGECRCPGGGSVCAGECRDTSWFTDNDAHCGRCDNACSGGSSCDGTSCRCPGGDEFCEGSCRGDDWFLENDAHCGGCGDACTGSQVCHVGSCCSPDCSGGGGSADGCGGICSLAPGDWVRLSAGTFTMGSPPSEPERQSNETQHTVTLTRDFEIQTTEVTQSQFEEMMGYNPSSFSSCGSDCPVESVNWHEAAAYCNELSAGAGLSECYDCTGSGSSVSCSPSSAYATPYACSGFRLPMESEWEYAARAGTTTARYGDLDAIAWYSSNSGSTTHAVAGKLANAWGLYDMLGNVWEWTHDWYDDYPSGSVTDPWGPTAGSHRVLRGGSWVSVAGYARAAFRNRITPDRRNFNFGFRPVRSD
jgi:formylglycine-generating enzyme required for sulfatase activity